jgi:hypothetical protein
VRRLYRIGWQSLRFHYQIIEQPLYRMQSPVDCRRRQAPPVLLDEMIYISPSDLAYWLLDFCEEKL